jgi:hypothetical protein
MTKPDESGVQRELHEIRGHAFAMTCCPPGTFLIGSAPHAAAGEVDEEARRPQIGMRLARTLG